MFSGEFIRDFLAFFMQNKIKHARRPLHLAGREVRRHPLTLTDRAAGLMPALTNPRQERKPPLYMPGLHRALALPDRARPPGCPGAAGMARGAMALPAPVPTAVPGPVPPPAPEPAWRPGPCRWQRCHAGAEPQARPAPALSPLWVYAAKWPGRTSFCLPFSFSPSSREENTLSWT